MSHVNAEASRNFNSLYQTGLRAAHTVGAPVHDCRPRRASGKTAAAYRNFNNAAGAQMEPVRRTFSRQGTFVDSLASSAPMTLIVKVGGWLNEKLG